LGHHIESSTISASQALVILSFLNGWRPDLINNAPVIGQWSIAVEMMFYVLLACIFTHVLTFRRAVCAWWGSLILFFFSYPLAVHLASLEGFSGDPGLVRKFAFWWFPTQLPIFVGGIGLYLILAESRSLWRSVLPYLPGVLLNVIVHRYYHEVPLIPTIGVLGIMFVALMARFSPLLIVNRFTAYLGKISFSAYLCHPPILVPLIIICESSNLTNPVIKFAIVSVVTLICVCIMSHLMWKFIERPGQRFGKLIINHLESRTKLP